MEQKLLLMIIHRNLKARPQDNIHIKQLLPYTNYILIQNNTWALRTSTLQIACKLDAKESKTGEQAIVQCRQIIVAMENTSFVPEDLVKAADVFGTYLQPTWKTYELAAELLHSAGCLSEALDIYKLFQMWEQVIACYVALDKKQEAVRCINKLLQETPTVKLLCMLGNY